MVAKVEVYSGSGCPFCDRAKSLLTQKGVAYTEIRVDQSDANRAEMFKRSGGQRTIPQIFINDQWIGGFDCLWDLEQKKELDSLLELTS